MFSIFPPEGNFDIGAGDGGGGGGPFRTPQIQKHPRTSQTNPNKFQKHFTFCKKTVKTYFFRFVPPGREL